MKNTGVTQQQSREEHTWTDHDLLSNSLATNTHELNKTHSTTVTRRTRMNWIGLTQQQSREKHTRTEYDLLSNMLFLPLNGLNTDLKDKRQLSDNNDESGPSQFVRTIEVYHKQTHISKLFSPMCKPFLEPCGRISSSTMQNRHDLRPSKILHSVRAKNSLHGAFSKTTIM